MEIDGKRTAVLALHWQVNVIEPEGFFGPLLAEPVARANVVARAARFHHDSELPVFFTRFTIPVGEGELVRNTGFMHAVGDAQEAFRPDAPGGQLVPEIAALLAGQPDRCQVVDNQKLSGLAGNTLAAQLTDAGITTILVTGVATNLTVEQTARHGTDLGFTVHVISDCVTAATEAAHQASLENLEMATAGCLTAAQALNCRP